MGRTKALLPFEGRAFLEVLLDRYAAAAVAPLIVVLGSAAEEVMNSVKLSMARVVVNPDPSRGQLSSVHRGLDALLPDEVDAVFLSPVDTPGVRTGTLERMMEALSGRSVVVPRFQGRRGHPALFAASRFSALRQASPEVGARAVVHAASDLMELPTEDPAVIQDFDRPRDLPSA